MIRKICYLLLICNNLFTSNFYIDRKSKAVLKPNKSTSFSPNEDTDNHQAAWEQEYVEIMETESNNAEIDSKENNDSVKKMPNPSLDSFYAFDSNPLKTVPTSSSKGSDNSAAEKNDDKIKEIEELIQEIEKKDKKQKKSSQKCKDNSCCKKCTIM